MPQSFEDAWADESYATDEASGVYVVAAALYEPAAYTQIRETMRGLRGRRRTAKLHWHEMDPAQRRTAAATVAQVAGLHIVSVATKVAEDRQQRARAACLELLVRELHPFGVHTLYMEARGPQLDAKDVRCVQTARYALPKGTRFRIEHRPGTAEPLFWVSDVVAGACRTGRQGAAEARDLLAEVVHEIDVPSTWD